MLKRAALIAGLMIATAMPAVAQAPPGGPPTRIRGTVDKLDGQTLHVKSRDGTPLTVALAANYTVAAVAKRTITDIKPGDFVAATSIKGTDGKQHAVELHIFVAAQRGVVPELQIPWDLIPDSLMTNAIVGSVTAAPNGATLKMTYKGTEAEIIADPGIPIVTYVPGDPSLLKSGAAIFIIAQKQPDGTLTTARVTAEKDGVKPPM
jgi:hypothetical protein